MCPLLLGPWSSFGQHDFVQRNNRVGRLGFLHECHSLGLGRFSEVGVESREGQAGPLRQFEISSTVNGEAVLGSHSDHRAPVVRGFGRLDADRERRPANERAKGCASSIGAAAFPQIVERLISQRIEPTRCGIFFNLTVPGRSLQFVEPRPKSSELFRR